MGSTGKSKGKSGGQRTNTTSASGQKARTAATPSGKGSRVEPSHITEKARAVREKKSSNASKK